jgi:hypothetical protein
VITGGTDGYDFVSIANLPPGLNAILSGDTVYFSGTPTRAGTFSNIDVRVEDSTGAEASRTYSLTVNAPPPPPPTKTGWYITVSLGYEWTDNNGQFHSVGFAPFTQTIPITVPPDSDLDRAQARLQATDYFYRAIWPSFYSTHGITGSGHFNYLNFAVAYFNNSTSPVYNDSFSGL